MNILTRIFLDKDKYNPHTFLKWREIAKLIYQLNYFNKLFQIIEILKFFFIEIFFNLWYLDSIVLT